MPSRSNDIQRETSECLLGRTAIRSHMATATANARLLQSPLPQLMKASESIACLRPSNAAAAKARSKWIPVSPLKLSRRCKLPSQETHLQGLKELQEGFVRILLLIVG
mmetsp:Transcript_49077/g.88210  ORF Transcript_49077/g.88210 Transcript_49077/m.88210 type:complete len:108 (-) Transcript_49077:58-381(-)